MALFDTLGNEPIGDKTLAITFSSITRVNGANCSHREIVTDIDGVAHSLFISDAEAAATPSKDDLLKQLIHRHISNGGTLDTLVLKVIG